MVTKRQIDKLRKKVDINHAEIPKVFMKNKDGEIKDMNGNLISEEELEEQLKNSKSSVPDIVLVCGEQ